MSTVVGVHAHGPVPVDLGSDPHERTALAVLAFLSTCAEARHDALTHRLGLTHHDVHRALKVLTRTGWTATRTHRGGTSWSRLTCAGRRRFAAHHRAVRESDRRPGKEQAPWR